MHELTLEEAFAEVDEEDAVALDPSVEGLQIGSDVEIARRLRNSLQAKFGKTPYAEGSIWRYAGTHWEPILDEQLRRMAHQFDGADYPGKRGERAVVRLTKSKLDSVLNELRCLLSEPDFFAEPEQGINCASGFIMVDQDGEAVLLEHAPDHRQRDTLAGDGATTRTGHRPTARCSRA